jgi:hypothetical protein
LFNNFWVQGFSGMKGDNNAPITFYIDSMAALATNVNKTGSQKHELVVR